MNLISLILNGPANKNRAPSRILALGDQGWLPLVYRLLGIWVSTAVFTIWAVKTYFFWLWTVELLFPAACSPASPDIEMLLLLLYLQQRTVHLHWAASNAVEKHQWSSQLCVTNFKKSKPLDLNLFNSRVSPDLREYKLLCGVWGSPASHSRSDGSSVFSFPLFFTHRI